MKDLFTLATYQTGDSLAQTDDDPKRDNSSAATETTSSDIAETPEAQTNHLVKSSHRSQRILIVDDETYIVATLCKGLSKLPNCTVFTAIGGQRAWQLITQLSFDLVITDYKMPDIDGLVLAERIRRLYPQTIIIMITAHSSDELRKRASEIPIQHILDKPVKLKELRSFISKVLEAGDYHNQV